MYPSFFKRTIDFFIALTGMIFLFPLFILIALLLAIVNRGDVFFTQERPGKEEKRFKVIKFKSMNDRKDARGNLLPDQKRLTRVGAFLRKSSLDELPQLINVLKGEMSLIGPRPLLVKYLPYYTERERLRHTVSPGITGWSQVNGRNLLNWDKRLALDVAYVENISFALDLKILFATLKKVIARKDIAVDVGQLHFYDLDDERTDHPQTRRRT